MFDPDNQFDTNWPPEVPIAITTKKAHKGSKLITVYPELTWVPIPLFSRRLVAALREAGVNNLQTFDTLLTNVQGVESIPPDYYLAVNIVGLLAAADIKKSALGPVTDESPTSRDFDSLAVDKVKTGNSRFFRLCENTSAVVAHECVKKHVEDAGITTLTWMKPKKWAG